MRREWEQQRVAATMLVIRCRFSPPTTRLWIRRNSQSSIIEELFYGDPHKNIKGACQKLIDGDHTFTLLYIKQKGEEGVTLTLKQSCCGKDMSANYVADIHFTTKMIYTYTTGKRCSGRSI
jgi:hypothetical protein